jgi:uncharacterized membrane protein
MTQKLLASVSAGNPPSTAVVFGASTAYQIAAQKAVLALDEVGKPDQVAALKKWMLPAIWDLGVYDGKFYYASMWNQCMGTFVNTKMCKERGVDPAKPPAPPKPAPTPAPQKGAGLRGAARGAAAGYIVGDLANDEGGEGAAIGAVVGGARAASKQKQAQGAAQQQQTAQQQQYQQQVQQLQGEYLKARAACLEAKGYTVK